MHNTQIFFIINFHDLKIYDRVMRFGVEARVPFLDQSLEFCFNTKQYKNGIWATTLMMKYLIRHTLERSLVLK